MLFNDPDYEIYRSGLKTILQVGFFAKFPAQIKIPAGGYLNALIHPTLPYESDVYYSVEVVKTAPTPCSDYASYNVVA